MSNKIKQAVREKYGAIAAEPDGSGGCCAPTCCGGTAAATAPSYAEVGGEVVAGTELGLGCGTPTQFAALKSGEAVLDLGSGAGVDLFLAAQHIGATGRAVGLDITEDMVTRARLAAAANGYHNVEVVLGDIEMLPFGDHSFDCVLSNCVVNLAPDKRRVFGEVWRGLRPGGRMAISDIVTVGQVPEDVRGDIDQWTGCIAGAMDRDQLLGLIRAASFERVGVVQESDYPAVSDAEYGAHSVTIQAWKPAAS